jgi:hypothetical protein
MASLTRQGAEDEPQRDLDHGSTQFRDSSSNHPAAVIPGRTAP